METLLTKLTSDDIETLIVFTFLFLGGTIYWVTLQWRLNRRMEIEAALKHDMLNRGMSAEEIERVMRATSRGCGADKRKST